MPPYVREARQRLVDRERGTLRREGRRRIGLLFPNNYAVAHASLGFQVVYRWLNTLPDTVCERFVLPDRPLDVVHLPGGPRSLETGRTLGEMDAVGLSIADELDLPHLSLALAAGGLAPLVAERERTSPALFAGGPLTLANPRPLGEFVDAVVVGDGEGLLPALDEALAAPDRVAFAARLAAEPGVYVPRLHGPTPPPPRLAPLTDLPAAGQILSPDAQFPDMFLIEVARGCPRACAFCLSGRPNGPLRAVPFERIVAAVPDDVRRVGFVGSAVSDHPDFRALLGWAAERGLEVGVSSLRVDRLDGPLLDLLRRVGYRTLTVAADAPSERLRAAVHKGVRAEQLLQVAEQARGAGFASLKVYVIIGLPGEDDADIDELVALALELAAVGPPLVLSVNPFVPKLRTPLAGAPQAPLAILRQRLARLERGLHGRARLRALSPRWALVQAYLAEAGGDAAPRIVAAATGGATLAAWRRALPAELFEPACIRAHRFG